MELCKPQVLHPRSQGQRVVVLAHSVRLACWEAMLTPAEPLMNCCCLAFSAPPPQPLPPSLTQSRTPGPGCQREVLAERSRIWVSGDRPLEVTAFPLGSQALLLSPSCTSGDEVSSPSLATAWDVGLTQSLCCPSSVSSRSAVKTISCFWGVLATALPMAVHTGALMPLRKSSPGGKEGAVFSPVLSAWAEAGRGLTQLWSSVCLLNA